MPTLSRLRKALLAIVALQAGAALAMPPPAPFPLATSTVIYQASATPSPTPMRRVPGPDPVPWSIGIPVLTGVSFKLPIPKVSLTHGHTTHTEHPVTATGRPSGMRPDHGLGGHHADELNGGHQGHGGQAAHGAHGMSFGMPGYGTPEHSEHKHSEHKHGQQKYGTSDYDIPDMPYGVPQDSMSIHSIPGMPDRIQDSNVSPSWAGDLTLPPLPGRHGHGRQRRPRWLRRRHLPVVDDAWPVWYERPHERPVTNTYDDFDDDDDVDMGPPPPWTETEPIVQDSTTTTRKNTHQTSLTHSSKVTGTGTKRLKKIWDAVKTKKTSGKGRGG